MDVQTGVPVIAGEAQAIAVARDFAESIADGAAERDRAGMPPRAEMARFDASGLLGIMVPRAYGGPELAPTALAEVFRIIAAADPAIAQTPQAHYLFVDTLAFLGTDAQQRRLFNEVLAGRRIGNALAERGTKHAQDLQTRLTADRDGRLRLDGRKYYCTGALTAHWIAVTALDDQERLVAAFVGREDDGVTVTEDWNVIGQRATVSGTTELDGVLVDPDLVLPYGTAFEGPQALGSRAQLVHAAIEVGIAGGALHDARTFLREKARPFFEAVRGGWAERASDDPHTLLRYGRMATQVRAAEALLAWAAGELDEVGLAPRSPEAAARASLAVAQAKAFGSEVAVGVAGELFALSGASAADARYGLDRHWRNARTHSIHDPADWKYHHVAAYEVNGTLPPNHGQL
ncbi:MAG TPA: SfnB family sulfur acquisition oxidoreductase [Solirubrobacteraceae bacterium]|jgi:SfnB family sulfur acquisition oxidoreductase|nr:SfnB family sulfur acquisition oxidoreductase [Solirubrobacteraceae bacterium]